jgi:predicted ester cyclase
MTKDELCDIYKDPIACLNRQDWRKSAQFVEEEARHNGRRLRLAGYRAPDARALTREGGLFRQEFRDF